MNSFVKQPNEKIPVSVDFTDVIGTTESIESLTVSAYDSAGTDVTSTMIVSSEIQSGDVCLAYVQAGTTWSKYKITFKASTALSVYHEEVYIFVIDK